VKQELESYRRQQEQKLKGKKSELDKLNEEKRKINEEFDLEIAQTRKELEKKLEQEKR